MIGNNTQPSRGRPSSGPAPATSPEALPLDAAALGRADASVGAPDPHAESGEPGRQPPGALSLIADRVVAKIKALKGTGLERLADGERYWLTLPDRLTAWRAISDALGLELSVSDPGRERSLARWCFTAITGGIAIGLLFETYLTDLALRFVDVPAGERRLIAFGIALGLTLIALVASYESRRHQWKWNPALWLAATVVVALTILRYGVLSENTAWWELAGATIVLGAAAAIFAVWAAFVEGRVNHAVKEHEQWQDHQRLRHAASAAQEQVHQIEEWHNGLPATVQRVCDSAVAEIETATASAAEGMSEYWVAYQQTNAAAAPDIRAERVRLTTELAGHTSMAINVLLDRTNDLRARMRPELSRKPKPPPSKRKETSNV